MKKAIRIFVFCLLLIAYVLTYLLLQIFTLCYDGLNLLEGVIRKAVHKKRGNLKGG